jgi:hypothetical protein
MNKPVISASQIVRTTLPKGGLNQVTQGISRFGQPKAPFITVEVFRSHSTHIDLLVMVMV